MSDTPVESTPTPIYRSTIENGEIRWSFTAPAQPIDGMCFSTALFMLKRDCRIARNKWKHKWIRLYRDSNTYISSYLLAVDVREQGKSTPWSPTHDDLLATDWTIVD